MSRITYILLLLLLFSCNNKRPQYKMAYIEEEPGIDGNLDSVWKKVQKENILGELKGKFMWKGDSDLSASFRGFTNGKNMYFFIEVVDDISKIPNDSTLAFYEQDNTELFFSKKGKRFKSENFSKDDSMYRFHVTYGNDGKDIEKMGGVNVICAKKTTRVGYNVEILLPILDDFFNKNKNIIFNIEITDSDNESKEEGFIKGRESTLSWAPREAGESYHDTRYFGELIFK